MACLKDKEVGIIDLDIETGKEKKEGVIAYLEMLPRFRKTGVSAQLLGQATSVFRALGRDTIRVSVAHGYIAARDYFRKYGFMQTGNSGDLVVFEKNILVG
jgi:probable phosphoglycerate mutase